MRDDESLRIISQPLWERVKVRQHSRTAEIGTRIEAGRKSLGRTPRYLFSRLMKCDVCGSSYVVADRYSYICSGYINGRICTNGHRARRRGLEDALLRAIKRDLLSDASIEEFKRRLRRAMTRPDQNIKIRAKLEAEVANLTDAIATGLLSPALARRLQDAEAAVAAMPIPNVTRMDDLMRVLPQAVERYRADGQQPARCARRYPAGALIQDLIGEIRVEPRRDRLIAKLRLQMQSQASQIRGSGGPLLIHLPTSTRSLRAPLTS